MGNLKVRTRVWRLTLSCGQNILRESILNENALLITSWQPLSLTRLCPVKLMPGRRALTAVRYRGPNVRTHIPGVGELRPSPSFSRRPAGYTRTLTGLIPPEGQGCSSPLGKGVRFRRRRRGQGGALCIPPPRRGQTPPTIPFPQQPRLGGWGPGDRASQGSGQRRRRVRTGGPTIKQCVQGRGAQLEGSVAEEPPFPPRGSLFRF